MKVRWVLYLSPGLNIGLPSALVVDGTGDGGASYADYSTPTLFRSKEEALDVATRLIERLNHYGQIYVIAVKPRRT